MTFGFNIEAKIEKCGSYLHKTQSASIFLNILEENDDSSHWPITNLQPATSDNLSEKDILKANIGKIYNQGDCKVRSEIDYKGGCENCGDINGQVLARTFKNPYMPYTNITQINETYLNHFKATRTNPYLPIRIQIKAI